MCHVSFMNLDLQRAISFDRLEKTFGIFILRNFSSVRVVSCGSACNTGNCAVTHRKTVTKANPENVPKLGQIVCVEFLAPLKCWRLLCICTKKLVDD